jgi:regulator of protease activity HflC (stomatin/prohibitin superfamily)
MFDKLFDFLLTILKIFQFLSVVDSWQKGVVLRLGKPQRDVGPGLIWLLPFFIDRLISESVALETLPVPTQSLTTKDGKSVVLGTVVSFTIEDVRKFLLEVEGRNGFIRDSMFGIQSKFVLGMTWEDLCTADIENELTKTAKRKAKEWGVAILRVQISDFSQSRSIRLMMPNSTAQHVGEFAA